MIEINPSYGYYPSSPRRTSRVGSIDYYKMKYITKKELVDEFLNYLDKGSHGSWSCGSITFD